jgi:hypothetical protein
MDRELICSWLQLSNGNWPPDHYTLLGLNAGESDPARIEQQVHERMEKVRHYQLTHPELATEAMNRLAQALVCLTDPRAKQVYDALLFPGQLSAIANPPPVRRRQGSSLHRKSPQGMDSEGSGPAAPFPSGSTVLDWESSPPPSNLDWESSPPPAKREWESSPPPAKRDWESAPPPSRRRGKETPPPEASGKDTQEMPYYPGRAEEADENGQRGKKPAYRSRGSKRSSRSNGYWNPNFAPQAPGLNTRRGLYYRAVLIRQLLWTWERAGGFLNQPARMIQRPSEATELIGRMTVIRELLGTVATPLGEAGRPGYLVLALARQELIVPMFQTLLPSQREALARDWQAGHQLLLAERGALLEAFRAGRARSRWLVFLRTVAAAPLSSPSVLFLLAVCLTLDVLFPEVRELWLQQVVSFAALLGLKALAGWVSLRPIRPRWTPPLARSPGPAARRGNVRRVGPAT